MPTLKFILGAIAFIAIYGIIDIVAGLIPFWAGITFLFAIIVGLIRLAFLIARETNK